MASSLHIYVDYLSQPCRSVGMLCRAINAPYKEHITKLLKGEQKAPEFLTINPLGKVPSVKDGNTVINESCSAMRYIATKYDTSGKWYPNDLDIRVKVDEYLDWQHANTRRHGAGYFYNKIIAPMRTKQPINMSVVNEHEKELARVEKEFVEYFLASKPFIVGDHLTIADLAAAAEFEQPLIGGYDLSQAVRDYLKTVKAEMGPVYDDLLKDIKSMLKA
ncbi:Glutathione S-transferase theta-1 [Halocaridina rubra]|uniref:Glutathione S-transferase theta-1 n=1 Tax=Halocaridina rubra TaxID=373956 RepID=A0AAN9ACN2_HALRR